jgi:hypothetical protein
LYTILFEKSIFQILWCRISQPRAIWPVFSGTHGIERVIAADNRRAVMREKKRRTIDLLNVIAIIGAVVCFI